MSSSFEEIRKTIEHIVVDFQLGDIERALTTVGVNFLATQGLVVCTEFLGGIRIGTLGDDKPGLAKTRFRAGLQLLGQQYEANVDEAWGLRCGLLHSYLPKGKPGRDYVIANDPHLTVGFQMTKDPGTGREKVIVNALAWLQDLKAGYAKLLDELQSDQQMQLKALDCFSRLPGLA